jgi:RecB family exonuclease
VAEAVVDEVAAALAAELLAEAVVLEVEDSPAEAVVLAVLEAVGQVRRSAEVVPDLGGKRASAVQPESAEVLDPEQGRALAVQPELAVVLDPERERALVVQPELAEVRGPELELASAVVRGPARGLADRLQVTLLRRIGANLTVS